MYVRISHLAVQGLLASSSFLPFFTTFLNCLFPLLLRREFLQLLAKPYKAPLHVQSAAAIRRLGSRRGYSHCDGERRLSNRTEHHYWWGCDDRIKDFGWPPFSGTLTGPIMTQRNVYCIRSSSSSLSPQRTCTALLNVLFFDAAALYHSFFRNVCPSLPRHGRWRGKWKVEFFQQTIEEKALTCPIISPLPTRSRAFLHLLLLRQCWKANG